MAIKKVTKKVVKATKAPVVRVETRKLPKDDTCSISACHTFKGLLLLVLFLVNTLLIVFVLVRQNKIEADKVG
jgi:hypothetical protein